MGETMTTEWVTVPREPTEAMVAAGRSYAVPSTQAIIPIYTAMLSACPPSPPVSGCEGNLSKRPVAFRVKEFVSGHLLFNTEDEARKCADDLGCEYQGLYVRDSTPLNFSDPPAQHGVFDALQWALAEIEGRTTYENDDQRAACLARARSALSDPPVRGEVVEALKTLGSAAEWSEKREALLKWTGSAIAGEKPIDEGTLSELYGFLCGLIGWLVSVENALAKMEERS